MDVPPAKVWYSMGLYGIIIPIGSMYAIYGNIYHQYTPNVSIYTMHGITWYYRFRHIPTKNPQSERDDTPQMNMPLVLFVKKRMSVSSNGIAPKAGIAIDSIGFPLKTTGVCFLGSLLAEVPRTIWCGAPTSSRLLWNYHSQHQFLVWKKELSDCWFGVRFVRIIGF